MLFRSIEFFIEGGRSRSGKSLPPRFGLLKELVAAQVAGAAQDVYIVPVGLSYEKIIEDASENPFQTIHLVGEGGKATR